MGEVLIEYRPAAPSTGQFQSCTLPGLDNCLDQTGGNSVRVEREGESDAAWRSDAGRARRDEGGKCKGCSPPKLAKALRTPATSGARGTTRAAARQ